MRWYHLAIQPAAAAVHASRRLAFSQIAQDATAAAASVSPTAKSRAKAKAEIIFDKAVRTVEAKYGRSELVFPKDIMCMQHA